MYLTTETLHDLMTSKSSEKTWIQYRFLLIYFIPKLSQKDLFSLLQRLPKEEKDILFRPGGIAKIIMPNPILKLFLPSTHVNNKYNDKKEELFSPISVIHTDRRELVTLRDTLVSLYTEMSSLFKLRNYGSDSVNDGVIQKSIKDDNFDTISSYKLLQNTVKKNLNGSFTTANNISSSFDTFPQDCSTEYVNKSHSPEEDNIRELLLDADKDISDTATSGNMIAIDNISRLRRKIFSMGNAVSRSFITPFQSVLPINKNPTLSMVNKNHDILSEAVTIMRNNYIKIASRSFFGALLTVIDSLSPVIIRTGITLSGLSGIGLLGYFGLIYFPIIPNNNRSRRLSFLSSYPSLSSNVFITLLSTILFGYSSAGIMCYMQSLLRRSYLNIKKEINNIYYESDDKH